MKKIAVRVAIAMGIAIILASVAEYLIDREQRERNALFAQELAKKIEKFEGASRRVKLDDVTEFGWQKVCILSPYMMRDDLERISATSISSIKWWSFGLDSVCPEEGRGD